MGLGGAPNSSPYPRCAADLASFVRPLSAHEMYSPPCIVRDSGYAACCPPFPSRDNTRLGRGNSDCGDLATLRQNTCKLHVWGPWKPVGFISAATAGQHAVELQLPVEEVADCLQQPVQARPHGCSYS